MRGRKQVSCNFKPKISLKINLKSSRPLIKNIMKKILAIAILYQNTIWIILVDDDSTRKLRPMTKPRVKSPEVIDLKSGMVINCRLSKEHVRVHQILQCLEKDDHASKVRVHGILSNYCSSSTTKSGGRSFSN